MRLTIHFQNGPAAVSLEPEGEQQETIDKVRDAIANSTVFELTDTNGDQYVLSGAAISYFVVPSAGSQPVGFGR